MDNERQITIDDLYKSTASHRKLRHGGNDDVILEDDDSANNIVVREIRQQLRREAELAAMFQTRRGLDDMQPVDHDPIMIFSPTAIRTSDDLITIDDTPSLTSDVFDVSDPGTTPSVRKPTMTYSSPGEAMVYRDMADLQRREAELRRHWIEMGLDLLPVEDTWIIDNEIDGVIAAQVVSTNQSHHPLGRSSTHESTAHVKCQTSDSRIRDNGNGIRTASPTGLITVDAPVKMESRLQAVEDKVSRDPLKSCSDQQAITSGRNSENVSTDDRSDVDDTIQCRPRDVREKGQLRRGRTKGRPSRDHAERRIEEEVAEMKRREAELRQMRQFLMSEITADKATTDECLPIVADDVTPE